MLCYLHPEDRADRRTGVATLTTERREAVFAGRMGQPLPDRVQVQRRLDVPGEVRGQRGLYEDFYCARGEMENRIKEQQLGLFADRTSTAYLRSNQLRLYPSSFACCLPQALHRLGLAGIRIRCCRQGSFLFDRWW